MNDVLLAAALLRCLLFILRWEEAGGCFGFSDGSVQSAFLQLSRSAAAMGLTLKRRASVVQQRPARGEVLRHESSWDVKGGAVRWTVRLINVLVQQLPHLLRHASTTSE